MAINTLKFLETCLKIKNKESQLVPLKLNPPQRKVYAAVKRCHQEGKPIRIIILKARQMGFSTLTEGMIFKNTFVSPLVSSGIVAHEVTATNNLFNMSKRFYETLSEELRDAVKLQASNAKEVIFANKDGNSTIKCMTAGNEKIGRSDTFQNLHISEYAFWQGNKERTLLGLLQAVPNTANTMVIIESTANGYDDFKMRWDAAVAGESDYIPIFCAWNEMPEYRMEYDGSPLSKEEKELVYVYDLDNEQIMWRRWCIRNNFGGDEKLFRQEYPSCVTGETRVGTDKGLIAIKDIVEGMQGTYGNIKKHYVNPKMNVYKVMTKDGYSVRASEEHPFFLTDGSEVELKDLKVGDKLELSTPILAKDYYKFKWHDFGVEHSITIDEKWGRFLGYFMGDGSLCKDTLSIVCDKGDTDVVEDCTNIITGLFGIIPYTRTVGSKCGGTEVRVSCVKFKPLFDTLGIIRRNGSYGIKRDVHVPEFIFQSPKSVIIEFLRGLFEADGFNDYNCPRIVLFSKYEKFLKDVQLLLLSCGVVSKFSSREAVNGQGYRYTANELIITGHRAVAFNEKVKFISRRKQARTNYPKTKAATKNELASLITSIELDGFEQTYNLTVDGKPEFDANGIHTHNCQEEAFLLSGRPVFDNEKIMARIRDLEKGYREHPYKEGYFHFEYNEQDRIKNESIVFVESHQRNYVRIYQESIPDTPYVIGGDTKGEGKDFYAGTVIKNTTGQRVATLHMDLSESKPFTHQMYAMGVYFNNALISIEINFNTAPIEELQRLNYPRQYVRRKYDMYTKATEEKFGFKTDPNTRPIIIDKEIAMINDNTHLFSDIPTLREAMTFVYNDRNKADAMSGNHDDMLMSDMIANECREQQSFLSKAENNKEVYVTNSMYEDYQNAKIEDRELLERLWGGIPKRRIA